MLTSLRLVAFKAWDRVGPLRLAPLTGFFGANSSGKTSLLQAILTMKQTAESADRAQVLNLGDERSLVSLGRYEDAVWGHDPSRGILLDLAWRPSRPFQLTETELPPVSSIEFEAAISGGGGSAMQVEQFTYATNVGRFGMKRNSSMKPPTYDLIVDAPGFKATKRQGRYWGLPKPIKCYDFPDRLRARYQNVGFLTDLALSFEEMLAGVYYLGPLRMDPQRDYAWAGGAPTDVGRRGEQWVNALLASRDRGRKNQRGPHKRYISVEEHVAQWLKELGLIYDFSVEALDAASSRYQVRVRTTPSSGDSLITDVGFGVSQVLPVLVLLAYVPRGSTVILEQPEIHLHPQVQYRLADVLIEAATVRGVQLIVESHSEHLLQRIQRRVAEAELGPEQVALYFAQFDRDRGRISELLVDDFGNIANWPMDFFGNALAEAAAMTEAAIGRRIGA
jgi:predicted ATPase